MVVEPTSIPTIPQSDPIFGPIALPSSHCATSPSDQFLSLADKYKNTSTSLPQEIRIIGKLKSKCLIKFEESHTINDSRQSVKPKGEVKRVRDRFQLYIHSVLIKKQLEFLNPPKTCSLPLLRKKYSFCLHFQRVCPFSSFL